MQWGRTGGCGIGYKVMQPVTLHEQVRGHNTAFQYGGLDGEVSTL